MATFCSVTVELLGFVKKSLFYQCSLTLIIYLVSAVIGIRERPNVFCMDSPQISVLMPVFNAAPWLRTCLDSIREQTLPNWQLCAVDDHSTDESAAILQEYAQMDARITWQRNSGKGIIPALRKAYAQATAPYITRMDADDIMPPLKLERLYQALPAAKRGYLSTGLVDYFSDGILQDGYRRYADWLNASLQSGHPYRFIYRECVIPSPCWMIHREDLEQAQAFQVDRYPEDYDLVFRFYQEGIKPLVVDEVLHWWRDHPQRSSRTLEQYAAQEYFKLKVPWFLKLDYQPGRPLVLWGGGRKGKSLARHLIDQGVPFHWICDTASKWGHSISGRIMKSPDLLEKLVNPQLIIGVSGPTDQVDIRKKLQGQNRQEGEDFFFFV